jgi:hypothetical protein
MGRTPMGRIGDSLRKDFWDPKANARWEGGTIMRSGTERLRRHPEAARPLANAIANNYCGRRWMGMDSSEGERPGQQSDLDHCGHG